MEAFPDLTTPYHGSEEYVTRDDYRPVAGMMIPHAFVTAARVGRLTVRQSVDLARVLRYLARVWVQAIKPCVIKIAELDQFVVGEGGAEERAACPGGGGVIAACDSEVGQLLHDRLGHEKVPRRNTFYFIYVVGDLDEL